VRRTTRPHRKRFYTATGVIEAADGFAITLDDRPVRTPSGRPLVAPTRDIAEAMAAEWAAQNDNIDPLTMPLTRFANSVVDAVTDKVGAVADDIAKYLGTDLLFYRAGHPRRWWRGKQRIGIPWCIGRPRRSAPISFSPKALCMCGSPMRR
jgi:chaperone required for assembly of F1-ATPase